MTDYELFKQTLDKIKIEYCIVTHMYYTSVICENTEFCFSLENGEYSYTYNQADH